MKRIFIILVFLSLTILFVGYTFLSTGYFRDIQQEASKQPSFEPITTYEIPGVEDMAICYVDSFMILSSDDRALKRTGKITQGALYLMNLKNKEPQPVVISGAFEGPFSPHGIDLLKTSDTTHLIWVVNHPEENHTIELFEWNGSSLNHLKTYKDQTLQSPNDVVGIGINEFYFTNDHGFTSKLGVLAENYLGLAVSNVYHVKNEVYNLAADNIGYANGLAIDRKTSVLFVASPRTFSLLTYLVNPSGTLEKSEEIKVGTGIDNLSITEEGQVWSGGHPNLLKFTSYAAGKSKISPSEVVSISFDNKESPVVSSVFLDDGRKISGASAAILFGSQLYIGNVMDTHFIRVQMASTEAVK
jgi:arylesterase/paraoxonase